ncbi:hypothetical protein ACFWP3_09615 [Streptomyces sp. NPDC058525]|uniref:hypothetical protein n=1 Tax=Streptomyces sp. NPDC058525 TaxID=3346538 RepID=UPI003663070A
MVYELHTLAAPAALGTGGKLLGSLGAGSVAIALLVYLIFGVKGKGDAKIKSWRKAFGIAFLFASACVSAGQMWTIVPDVGGTTGGALADGLTGAGLGDVKIAGIALICTVLIMVIPMKPAGGAWAGVLMSGLFTAAGAIWALPPTLLTNILSSLINRLG